MPLTDGLQLPFGIQPVNPIPVNTWEGPYNSFAEALITIPIGVRYPTMEVSILDSITGNKKYWFKDGITDNDLILFGIDASFLTGETQDRIDADINLQDQITGLTEEVDDNYYVLNQLITGETATRINQNDAINDEITGLTSSINDEVSNRISGDTINYNLITGETARAEAAEEAIDQSKWQQAPDIIINNGIKYGRLYNFYTTINSKGLIPEGWHIPTKDEWETMITYIIGIGGSGSNKFRKIGEDPNWLNPNIYATNDTGFSALPSGSWNYTSSSFSSNFSVWLNTSVVGWDGTQFPNNSWYGVITTDNILYTNGNKLSLLSIRLIKDDLNNEGDIIIDGDTYHSVTIGSQVWLKESLAVTHYLDGSLIGTDYNSTDGAVRFPYDDENNVYDIVTVSDPTHIQPKDSKRIQASIIDNLPVYEEIGIASSLVSGETNRAEIVETGLTTSINVETFNRITGDTTNYDMITGETANRIIGDINLQNEITDLTATFTTDIEGLNSGKENVGVAAGLVGTETSRAEGVEGGKANKTTQIAGVVLLAVNWVLNASVYEYIYNNILITSDSYVDVIATVNGNLAVTAGVSPLTSAYADNLVLYANSRPTGDITVTLIIYQ